MRTLRMLIIAAVIAMLAVPALAAPILVSTGSCPVNLKIQPVATIVPPAKIDVTITTIDGAGKGSSSGLDSGTFLLSTNLPSVQISAVIGNPGLTGGTWGCHLQGHAGWAIGPVADTDTYPGSMFISNVPFVVFVQVTNVDMLTVPWGPLFNYDTTLTLTMSIP